MLAANDQKVPATDGEEEGYKLEDEVAATHEHRAPLVPTFKKPRPMGAMATVIRTNIACSRFLGFECLKTELQPDRWTISGSEGFRRFFIYFPMDQAEINNWISIAESMEAKGDTESWFYLRARAIADGKADPMPNISELMTDPS